MAAMEEEDWKGGVANEAGGEDKRLHCSCLCKAVVWELQTVLKFHSEECPPERWKGEHCNDGGHALPLAETGWGVPLGSDAGPDSVQHSQCCHCSICRKVSGSPYLHNIIVPPSGFVVTKGEAHTFKYASSKHIERVRCRTCGSYLWAVSDTFEQVFAVPIGVVDNPCEPNGELKEVLRPQHHICYGDKLCSVPDGTPKYRSLPGGERMED